MHQLTLAIAAELEHPRELTAQVVKHLDGAYGVDRDAIGAFLKDKLPKLEDYEHDLILSPLFTPKLKDQAIFAEALGRNSIPRQDWTALVLELLERPTHAQLISGRGEIHRVALREVSIERFVHRLRLDGTISESVFDRIEHRPAADRPMLKAIARRSIWENPDRGGILDKLLQRPLPSGASDLSDAVLLLKLMEDYQPASSLELLGRIPKWQRILEEEIHTAFEPKPFFSTTVQQLHGGNDQRQRDEARAEAKRIELAFLERLQTLLED